MSRYEDIVQLRDTELHTLEVKERAFYTARDEEFYKIEGTYEKQLDKFNKEFEKEVRKLFKGIKINIIHNKTRFGIEFKNDIIFSYMYNAVEGRDVDCFDELVEIYHKYYGKPKKEKYYTDCRLAPQLLKNALK